MTSIFYENIRNKVKIILKIFIIFGLSNALAQNNNEIVIDTKLLNENYLVTELKQTIRNETVSFKIIELKNSHYLNSKKMNSFVLSEKQNFDRIVFLVKDSGVSLDCDNRVMNGYRATEPYGLRGSLLDTTSVNAMSGIVIENNFANPLENIQIKNCHFKNINQYGIRVRNENADIRYQNWLKNLNQTQNEFKIDKTIKLSSPQEFVQISEEVIKNINLNYNNSNLSEKQKTLLNQLKFLNKKENNKLCLKLLKKGRSDFARASEYDDVDRYSLSESDYKCLTKFKMKNVLFQNVSIDNTETLDSSNCVNLATGVHGVVFDGLKVSGCRGGVYFSPNSSDHQIKNSIFDNSKFFNEMRLKKYMALTKMRYTDELREAISIDAAQKNTIGPNNQFISQRAGVMLYKNCWENYFDPNKPDMKNSRPRAFGSDDNVIINNKFTDVFYGVWIASRQSVVQRECGDEYIKLVNVKNPYVGFVKDYASRNIIKDNVFNLDKFLDKNSNLTQKFLSRDPKFSTELAKHDLFSAIINEGSLNQISGNQIGLGWKNSILNSIFTQHSKRRPIIDTNVILVKDHCSIDGLNEGCTKVVKCPVLQGLRMKMDHFRVACNLETSTEDLDIFKLPLTKSEIVVHRASEKINDGLCQVNNEVISEGKKDLVRADFNNSLQIGCSENDANGGDCRVSVVMKCIQ